MRKIYSSWLSMLTIVLLIGCAEEQVSDLKFGVLNSAKTSSFLLPMMDAAKTNKSLKVCIIKSDSQIFQADINNLKKDIKASVNLWADPLKSHKKWTATNYKFKFNIIPLSSDDNTKSKCLSSADMGVYLTYGNADFQTAANKHNVYSLPSPRSFALPDSGLMVIAYENYSITGQWLIAHEVGHLMGMGDVYAEQSTVANTDPILNQHPTALMGTGGMSSGIPKLFVDDRRGIKAIFSFIQKDKLKCGKGRGQYDSTGSRGAFTDFCLPNKLLAQNSNEMAANIHNTCPNGSPKLAGNSCRLSAVSSCSKGFVPVAGGQICCPKSKPYFDDAKNKCSKNRK